MARERSLLSLLGTITPLGVGQDSDVFDIAGSGSYPAAGAGGLVLGKVLNPPDGGYAADSDLTLMHSDASGSGFAAVKAVDVNWTLSELSHAPGEFEGVNPVALDEEYDSTYAATARHVAMASYNGGKRYVRIDGGSAAGTILNFAVTRDKYRGDAASSPR